jgi:tricorn protease
MRIFIFLTIISLSIASQPLAGAQDSAQDSALWLRNPAISPDGSTIAFTYQGDLYSVPANGGRANQLTTFSGRDTRPVWSPDGTQLAFASDRYGNLDVFVMPSMGGAPARLTFDSRDDIPSVFTPDGMAVYFESGRVDAAASSNFPTGAQPELYSVPVTGGRVSQVLTVPALNASLDPTGRWMLFEDITSYENAFRKHHTSSAARDIWTVDLTTNTFTQNTDFAGEDRSPSFTPDGSGFFYLSEFDGTMNVYRKTANGAGSGTKLTSFSNHPVRSLSVARDGKLAFSWDGELWTLSEGSAPSKLTVLINRDPGARDTEEITVSGSVTQMAPSPNGKEVAFIFRGDVFVTSVESGVTKQITRTVEAENWVSFDPKGRSLVYASERDGSWNLYESSIRREEEKYFFLSTAIEEKVLLKTDADEFQPVVSPDGNTVAYIKDRMTLAVVDRVTSTPTTLMGSENFFSYSDGDQSFSWSPDSKWIFVEYSQPDFWPTEIGLIKADGSGTVRNMTDSGFADSQPKWMMGGKLLLWFSSRDGKQDLASTGSRESDAYGMFLTQKAWQEFNLSKEEAELLAEAEKEAKKDEKKEDEKKEDDKKVKEVEPVVIDWDRMEDRKARLTIHSSSLSDAVVTPDGETMLYLSRFEKGYDLWKTNLRTKETSVLAKMGGSGGSLTLDEEGKNVFMLAGGKMSKVDVATGKISGIAISGSYQVDRQAEFEYNLGFAWRWINKKFYKKDHHGVDWPMYLAAYQRFLPNISNGYDFQEVLNEMLGELNVSHTGAGFNQSLPDRDATAAFGLLMSELKDGSGLRIDEVLAKGPLDRPGTKVKKGVVLEKVNGITLGVGVNTAHLLNDLAGTNVLLSFRGSDGKAPWEEVVKAITASAESSFLYERWVESRRALVDSLSGGRLGYVHVRSMSDPAYRVTFEDALGRQATTEAMVVDTRWNGGGDLVDDLSTFLNGFRYATFTTRDDRVIGGEPQRKWVKPSILLVNEGNYSDGHCFPYAYRTKKIGQIVGMPIAGTCSWVSGTGMPDGQSSLRTVHLSFDDLTGTPLENQQLEPDYVVKNTPALKSMGRDEQVERAVIELLNQLGGN